MMSFKCADLEKTSSPPDHLPILSKAEESQQHGDSNTDLSRDIFSTPFLGGIPTKLQLPKKQLEPVYQGSFLKKHIETSTA